MLHVTKTTLVVHSRSTSISSFKRKVPSDKSEIGDTTRLRSMSQELDIKTHCLYCAKITVTTQSAFLSNDGNKTRLISMLVQKFNDKFIKTRQAAADADRLLYQRAAIPIPW